MVFLEFTTGAGHPLSSVHTVSLPLYPEVEVLGDYLLVIAENVFSVVSWKTGANKQVSALSELFECYPNFEQGFIAL